MTILLTRVVSSLELFSWRCCLVSAVEPVPSSAGDGGVCLSCRAWWELELVKLISASFLLTDEPNFGLAVLLRHCVLDDDFWLSLLRFNVCNRVATFCFVFEKNSGSWFVRSGENRLKLSDRR